MRRVLLGAGLALVVSGCGGLLGSTPPGELSEPKDPTPLAKCRVAASASNPLVTEWPASEKAHLQSLAGRQAVAVEYTGCELRIVPECALPGRYSWHRTTLATDTLEISNSDELYAKLPIGAVGLEGELERSGRLAVHTTVAGQMRLEPGEEATLAYGCRKATHVVTAISVGAFMLSSGADESSGGGVGVAGVGAGARHSRGKSVLRTAGDPERCAESTGELPSLDCASPIQLFLTPLAEDSAAPVQEARSVPGSDRVQISFPAPEDGAAWSLRDADGASVCVLPCTTWVPKLSGYSLRREKPLAEIELPAKLSFESGSSVRAEYQAERGSPLLSTLSFYFVGLPTAAIAVGFGIWGATEVGCEESADRTERCFPSAGILFTTAGMMALMSGASTFWYLYSHEADLTLTPASSASARRAPEPSVVIGPGMLFGTF